MSHARAADSEDVLGSPLQALSIGSVVITLAAGFSLFSSQHALGLDGTAQRDARAGLTAMEEFYIGHHSYDADPAQLTQTDPRLRRANVLTASGTAETYVVSVMSRSPEHTVFTLTRGANGTVTRSCDTPGRGECSASGSW
jgi:hypothetical protein